MATIAYYCPDIEVHIVDLNQARINAWNSDSLPIYEPGLEEVVMKCRGKNLFFSTDVEGMVKACDIIFVSVNTPTKKVGSGAGRAANLCWWESCGRDIAKWANSSKIIVEKSTVPVRTAEALQRVLSNNQKDGIEFTILSNPEFLAEGTAMRDLAEPDRVLIGGNEDAAGQAALAALVDVYARWVPRERILTTNLWSSELSKLVANAFLAQRVSSINSISQLCEKTGANVAEISRAIGMDSRIGPKFLSASVGFGGSCFQKDILNLVYICESFGLFDVAKYWQGVVDMNDLQKEVFVKRMVDSMFHNVNGKKIAIFGFAFKKDTGDVRETPAIHVCHKLLDEGAILHIWDPKVSRESALREFKEHNIEVDESRFITCSSAAEAVDDSHAIAVLTEWDEFKKYDYEKFMGMMHKPAFLFDGRNIIDHEKLSGLGFEVHSIGKTHANA
jgi:UDPglucose 6-dehydrogenase